MQDRGHGRVLLFAALLLALGTIASPLHGQNPKISWGNPDQPWGTRRPVTDSDRSLLANFRSGKRHLVYSADFADDSKFLDKWNVQIDDRSDLKSCREKANVVVSDDRLQLKTLKAAHCHAQYSTGSIESAFRQQYGFFEASIKIADTPGLNNAFWLTTEDKYEIDIAEVHYPDDVRITLHNNNNWTPGPEHAVGFDVKYTGTDFSRSYHDFGAVWTPTDLIFEVDGQAVTAIAIKGAHGAADIRFSTALGDFGGKIPADPTGHEMSVKSLRVFGLD